MKAVMSKLFVQHDVKIDDTKSVSLLSSQYQELHPVRSLQNSSIPTMNPSSAENMNWTDDRICEAFVDNLYKSEYERSMKPCTCQRSAESIGYEVGDYIVDCKYDYCEECSKSLCGYLSFNLKFIVLSDPSFPYPTEHSYCIQYTSGRDDKVCWRTEYDYNTRSRTDQILVADQVCTSAEYASCGVDSGTTSENKSNGTDSTRTEEELSFDCSNINGLYAMNMCSYVPYTDISLPTPDANDPFLLLSDDREWGTCYNSSGNGSNTRTSINSSALSASSSIVLSLLVAANSVALLLTVM
jgi:hypothetical protein